MTHFRSKLRFLPFIISISPRRKFRDCGWGAHRSMLSPQLFCQQVARYSQVTVGDLHVSPVHRYVTVLDRLLQSSGQDGACSCDVTGSSNIYAARSGRRQKHCLLLSEHQQGVLTGSQHHRRKLHKHRRPIAERQRSSQPKLLHPQKLSNGRSVVSDSLLPVGYPFSLLKPEGREDCSGAEDSLHQWCILTNSPVSARGEVDDRKRRQHGDGDESRHPSVRQSHSHTPLEQLLIATTGGC